MLSTSTVPGFRSLGQATARATALNAARQGRIGRTFLVHGPSGAGKGAFVEDLLALLFCTAAGGERPCNACSGCRHARARTHPDLVEGSPERWREMRSTGESVVAAARRWLGEAAGAPIAGDRRVVLIEGADHAGDQIQNALLKALEEPTDRHLYVLVAAEPSRLLPTVRSRCQPLRIGPVPRVQLASWLMDEVRLPADQADALARISGGLVGKALGYVADTAELAWRRRVQRELLALLDRGRADRLASARDLLEEATRRARPAAQDDAEAAPADELEPVRTPTSLQRVAATAIVEAWLALARDLLVAAAGRPEAAGSTELLPEIADLAPRIGVRPMASFIRLLERIHGALAQNASPRLALDVAMLEWPGLPDR